MRELHVEEVALELLGRVAPGAAPVFEQLAGGGNNRGYRVEAGGRTFFLKSYFRFIGDPRNRLNQEYSFIDFAWTSGVREVPEPLGRDDTHSLGLYEFIPGRPFATTDVSAEAVQTAATFFLELNRRRDRPGAKALGAAAEACFSDRDHFQIVERRLGELIKAEEGPGIKGEGARFIRGELAPAWKALSAGANPSAEALPDSERVLSPSDFGFHNAIRSDAGPVRFIDFEYAGWDDPVKMICDFVSHPKRPIPAALQAPFIEAALSATPRGDWHRKRIDLLLPVCRLKWCCIMLNAFLPMGQDRARFLHPTQQLETHMQEQLEKAKRALAQLQANQKGRL